MKTFATAKKINPAFKVAQPLPSWPVSLTGRERSAAAGAARLFPSQTEAPHEALDLASFAVLTRQDFRRTTPLTN